MNKIFIFLIIHICYLFNSFYKNNLLFHIKKKSSFQTLPCFITLILLFFVLTLSLIYPIFLPFTFYWPEIMKHHIFTFFFCNDNIFKYSFYWILYNISFNHSDWRWVEILTTVYRHREREILVPVRDEHFVSIVKTPPKIGICDVHTVFFSERLKNSSLCAQRVAACLGISQSGQVDLLIVAIYTTVKYPFRVGQQV